MLTDDQEEVTEFSLDKPRYDQRTYFGRWKHFVTMVDPTLLLCTREKLESSLALLSEFEKSDKTRGVPPIVSNADLWEARKIRDSMVHPQTHAVVPILFRLAAFVPVNIPICAGMLLTRPTLLNTVFWQWANQSYNAGFNYANRNASSDDTESTSAILTAYASATAVSCLSAVGLGKLVQQASSLTPSVQRLIQRTVPFLAVASAGSFNAVFMRQNELRDGIDVTDGDGKSYGKSKAAAKQSLTQVALTRIAIPMPILLLPPYIMEGLKKVRLMPTHRVGKAMAELSIITICLWGAFPSSIALFPQYGSIHAADLEPEFQSIRDATTGEPIDQFYYNKGI